MDTRRRLDQTLEVRCFVPSGAGEFLILSRILTDYKAVHPLPLPFPANQHHHQYATPPLLEESQSGQPHRRATQPLVSPPLVPPIEFSSPSGQSEKRKMQNRAAQKSFRERRDRYLKDLEERVANQAELDVQTSNRIRECVLL
jgi:hypothetical protein